MAIVISLDEANKLNIFKTFQSGNIRNDLDNKEIISLYNSGLSCRKIAEKLKAGKNTILRRLKKAGIQTKKIPTGTNMSLKKETAQKYYEKNKEEIKKQHKDFYKKNKERIIAMHMKYYHKNKEKMMEYKKEYHIKATYNITFEQLDKMLIEQKHKCLICDKSLIETRRCIDHDHKTGKIRGILCIECNSMIGFSHDNIDILKQAIGYLKRCDIL